MKDAARKRKRTDGICMHVCVLKDRQKFRIAREYSVIGFACDCTAPPHRIAFFCSGVSPAIPSSRNFDSQASIIAVENDEKVKKSWRSGDMMLSRSLCVIPTM